MTNQEQKEYIADCIDADVAINPQVLSTEKLKALATELNYLKDRVSEIQLQIYREAEILITGRRENEL